MQKKYPLSDEVREILEKEPGLGAAADILDQEGRMHGWFKGAVSWREIDPIGQEEFLSLAGRIIDTYHKASVNPAPGDDPGNTPHTPPQPK